MGSIIKMASLPAPEKTEVTLGYLKLTDAAPLIIAAELGYFTDAGLDVSLHQDVSWANLRDRLAVGALDGAQMPAPLPAMASLGVSGLRVPLISGLVISRNGNAITLGRDLLSRVSVERHLMTDRQLSASIIADLLQEKDGGMTLAVVHAFSTHNLLLRRWLKQGGVDPDHDVNIIIVPPSQVVDSLQEGLIDGFCAGAPWGTIASIEDVGVNVAAGIDVWRNAPEKVFCVSEPWHEAHPATHLRLRLALMKACEWLADMSNRLECAEILSMPCYLDLDKDLLLPSLSGEMQFLSGENASLIQDFHLFNPRAPQLEEFETMISECMAMIGNKSDESQLKQLAKQTARADLFTEAQEVLHPVEYEVS